MTIIPWRAEVSPRALRIGFAWAAMLLMSRLPQIIFKELFAIETSFVGTWLGMVVVLLAITYRWPTLQPLRGYLVIMAVIALVTGPFDTLLRNNRAWTTGFSQERGWAISFLGERLPLVIEALVLMLVLVARGVKRQDFFLAVGNVHAPVVSRRPPTLGNTWLSLGLLAALLLTLFFFFGTAMLTGVALTTLPDILPWLPMILFFGLMNAFGEEFVYRAAPLSQLGQVVGATQAIWLTAVWFGLGHYYGGIPNGLVGALLAGGIALLYGKAMVETRGLVLPTVMHMVTDVAIYLLLALAAMDG